MPLVHNEINDKLNENSMRGLPIPPLLKLLAVLRFYGTGNFQIVTGDLVGISQPTISRCVKDISRIIASKLPLFVKFPTTLEGKMHNQVLFYNIAGFVGIDGVVDCTHIPIINPGGNQGENFRNRKGIFSINVQIVSGPRCEILDIVARWPGSVHDSRIFSNSYVNIMYEQKKLPGHLLGDGGYPLLEYLFTPVRNPQNRKEERYNKAQITTRNTVERLNGIYKRRFSCLSKKLATKLNTTLLIISACAVLHNIAICRLEELPYTDEVLNDNQVIHQEYNGPPNLYGNVVRAEFINRHFS